MNAKKSSNIAHKESEMRKRVMEIQKYMIRSVTLAIAGVATITILAIRMEKNKRKDNLSAK